MPGSSGCRPACWPRCVMVAPIAMGLFSRRLRDRTVGVVLRIGVSVTAGALLGGLLLYVSARSPSNLHGNFRFRRHRVVFANYRQTSRPRPHRRRHPQASVLVYGSGNNAARILAAAPPERSARFQGGRVRASPQRGPRDSGRQAAEQGRALVTTAADLRDRRDRGSHGRPPPAIPTQGTARLPPGGHRNHRARYRSWSAKPARSTWTYSMPSWMIFGAGFRRDVLRRYHGTRFRPAQRVSRCCCWRCRSCC